MARRSTETSEVSLFLQSYRYLANAINEIDPNYFRVDISNTEHASISAEYTLLIHVMALLNNNDPFMTTLTKIYIDVLEGAITRVLIQLHVWRDIHERTLSDTTGFGTGIESSIEEVMDYLRTVHRSQTPYYIAG